MNMRKISAIINKQLKDTLKNKEVLIQFLLFPIFALILENTITIAGMEDGFFVKMFAGMYIGMAPLTAMASIMAEEKEKNTLRVLMMSNVKAGEYLVGVGSYVWVACMLGSCVLAIAGGYTGVGFLIFIGIMCIGIITSILIGAANGTLCRNQMAATSITVPVMMVFAFLPMISMFNENIGKVSKFTYSQQVSILINQIGNQKPQSESIIVIVMNMAVVFILFVFAYRKGNRA